MISPGDNIEENEFSRILSEGSIFEDAARFVDENWKAMEFLMLAECVNEAGEKLYSPLEIREFWRDVSRRIVSGGHPDHLNFYIHIPFCEKKCAYCSYYSAPPSGKNDMGGYTGYVKDCLDFYHGAFSGVRIRNFYMGGGTPTMLPAADLTSVFSRIGERFAFHDVGERALEANPISLTYEKLKAARDFGINRISMGVQTFGKRALEMSNRDYQTFDMVKKATEIISEFDFERGLTLDMIAGLEGDDDVSFTDSFEKAMSLRPRLIIVYPLRPTPVYVSKYYNDNIDDFLAARPGKAGNLAELLSKAAGKHGYYHSGLGPGAAWSFTLEEAPLDIIERFSRFLAGRGRGDLAGLIVGKRKPDLKSAFSEIERSDPDIHATLLSFMEAHEAERKDDRNI